MATILFDTASKAYPLSIADFRSAHPDLVVGDNPTDEDVTPYLWRVVSETPPPAAGEGQQVVLTSEPELREGRYYQAWELVDLPPRTDWGDFSAWLFRFPPLAPAMAEARTSTDPQGEPATSGLPAALLEARSGNYAPWAGAWALFLGASHLPEEALEAIVAKAAACNLPPEFLETLTPPAGPPLPHSP